MLLILLLTCVYVFVGLQWNLARLAVARHPQQQVSLFVPAYHCTHPLSSRMFVLSHYVLVQHVSRNSVALPLSALFLSTLERLHSKPIALSIFR